VRSIALLLIGLSALCPLAAQGTPAGADKIHWVAWSNDDFATAKREHKFVLLDLQAVWCHWCHVMDKETYDDPKVIALVNARYIAVKVDQDSRPDLANRYENYGWPATVVFNADGGEIVKRQGYIPPVPMASMLQAIIDDPTPGPSVSNAAPTSGTGDVFSLPAGEQKLQAQFEAGYDHKLGGWGFSHKFLDWDSVEYAMTEGLGGDAEATKMARQTLDAQLKLIDPVWGGVDQYSIDDWDHPHFEKLMQMQAEDMRIYAQAYEQYHDPAYLQAARHIDGYVRQFLTGPDDAVYTSQDADVHPGQAPEPYFKLDDAGRRRIGLPRVDQHIYARENGWFIQALCGLFSATGEPAYRDEAKSEAGWIVTHRSVPGGGFKHGEEAAPLYLGDTLTMGRAFLDLYSVTGEAKWLAQSGLALSFIRSHFAAPRGGPGFVTSNATTAGFQPIPEYDENVALARFANLLFHYTNNAADRETAETALRYPATPDLADSRHAFVGGLLLAELEFNSDPLHIVIVGERGNPAATQLLGAALAFPSSYKQIEQVEPGTPGAKPYPDLSKPAAYVCFRASCSSPVFDAPQLSALLAHQYLKHEPAK
jgi:uncharacterized protein YyaL (SSP411 family)